MNQTKKKQIVAINVKSEHLRHIAGVSIFIFGVASGSLSFNDFNTTEK